MTIEHKQFLRDARRRMSAVAGDLNVLRHACSGFFEPSDEGLFDSLDDALGAMERRLREITVELQDLGHPNPVASPNEAEDAYPRGSA